MTLKALDALISSSRDGRVGGRLPARESQEEDGNNESRDHETHLAQQIRQTVSGVVLLIESPCTDSLDYY